MTLFHALLMLSALLCSIVAGFLFAFAVVVMPGLKRLSDADFIRTFRAIDGVIQRNQPLFLVVWVGSILAVVLMAALALATARGVERQLAIVAALVYLIGVQATTFVVNIPLNNRLQALDVGSMNEGERARARSAFESRWTRWNTVRTACAALTSILLIVLLVYA